MVDDHAAEEPKDNYDIGLWGFEFNWFEKDEEKGGVKEGFSEYTYLLMSMMLCIRYWGNH